MTLTWFLSGSACVLLGQWCLRRFGSRSGEPRQPAPLNVQLGETRTLRELSESLGEELAILASGVEGQSQLMCEALDTPIRAAEHAEQVWETVRRLRFLSEKLQCASLVPPFEMQPTDVRQLLGNLVPEIENYAAVSFQVSLATASSLPMAMAQPEALGKAVLFLIESVFELEPNASKLAVQAQSQSGDHDELVVCVDIEAHNEDDDEDEVRVASSSETMFSLLAAQNLLQAQGAEVSLRHTPGLNATASITLEATSSADAEPPSGLDEETPHQFGGVLVMEGNPTIRHMLARELHKTERNVIVCADGVAATSLFEATPERFEALILEQESRRIDGQQVALRALATRPDMKIVMITPAPGTTLTPELASHENLRIIHKPFGMMEIRESLGSLLGPAPLPGSGIPADSAPI